MAGGAEGGLPNVYTILLHKPYLIIGPRWGVVKKVQNTVQCQHDL